MQYGQMNLFSIPVYTGIDETFPSYKDQLIDYIDDHKNTYDSQQVSNIKGYQSASNIHHDPKFETICRKLWGNAIQTGCDLLHRNFDANGFDNTTFSLLNIWFNINNPGSWNTQHTHPHCFYSGVLWVKAPKDSGDLIIHSPHAHDLYGIQGNAWSIPPEEGRVVLFPSFLVHNVNTNSSQRDRISISFNILMDRNQPFAPHQ